MNRQFIKIALAIALVLQTTILLAQATCTGTYSSGSIASITDVDIITGLYYGDGLGYKVSNIGDFNGDGIDDISLSATYASANSTDQFGEIYVIFGNDDLNHDFNGLDLSQLGKVDGPKGFKIPGVTELDRLGYGGGNGIGDINKDGYDDLVVSTPYTDPNEPDEFPTFDGTAPEEDGFGSGTAYIVFGTPSILVNEDGEFDLNSLNGNNGFSITGTHYFENVGTHAGSAGDFNNDGIDDFYVTADDSNLSGESVGALFLIYGKDTNCDPNVTFDACYIAHEMGTNDALVIVGDGSADGDAGGGGDNLGISAAPLNDINGDGITDLLIGASHANDNRGGGYVVFGYDGVNPDALHPNAEEFDITYDHLHQGQTFYDVTIPKEELFNRIMMLKVENLTHGFAIIGSQEPLIDNISARGGNLGWTTGDAGDLNGDGINDLYIGGFYERNTGACYIIYGSNDPFGTVIDVDDISNDTTDEIGVAIFGETNFSGFGFSASSIGDFNGDSIDDIIVGAAFGNGSVYVIYGQDDNDGQDGSFGTPILNLSNLNSATLPNGFRLYGEDNSLLGFSVDGLLDLNGDHRKEIIVGAEFGRVPHTQNPHQLPPGKAYILHSMCELSIEPEIKVFLEGAYDKSTNQHVDWSIDQAGLHYRGLLPGMTPRSNLATPTPKGQPYNTNPWNYAGTEGANFNDTSYSSNDLDWILVSFRSGTAKNTEVLRVAAILQLDGTIKFVEPITFNISSVYIVIEHRNHLPVMSHELVPINNNSLAYDFSTQDSYTGDAGFGQKEILPNIWAAFAGNAQQVNTTCNPQFNINDINGGDKTVWDQNNGKFDHYNRADMDLNADVNGNDKPIWVPNNGFSSRIPQ